MNLSRKERTLTAIDELYEKLMEQNEVSHLKLRQNSERLKCLEYYLNHQNKITLWNNEKKLFEFTFMRFNFTLTMDFTSRLNDLYVNNIAPMMPLLKTILEEGWRLSKITKKKYNLIVYFYDFCQKFHKTISFAEISPKNFFLMEESFFRLTCNTSFEIIIRDALENFMVHQNRSLMNDDAKLTELTASISRFFSRTDYSPSIYDLILAYNMVYYRRFFRWEELITEGINNIIPMDFYLCTQDVFKSIFDYIRVLLKNLKKLEKERDHIQWLKEFGDIHSYTDPEKLIEFYQSEGHNWLNDQKDVFQLFINIIEALVKKTGPLFFNTWELANEQSQVVKQKILKEKEMLVLFNKISNEFNLAKGRLTNSNPQKISYNELFQEEKPKIETMLSSDHKYVYDKMLLILTDIYTFTDYLIKILKNRGVHPELNYLLIDEETWCGKPVHNIYQYYTEILLQVCGLFKENMMDVQLKKLAYSEKQIKNIYVQLNEMSDNNQVIIDFIEKKNGMFRQEEDEKNENDETVQ